MERSIIFDENLTYDSLYDQSSNLKEDYELDTQIYVDDDFELKNEEKKYSKEEVENILKESIENMVIEIKKVIDKKFGEYNFVASYNKYIDNWNEVVCSIDIDGQVVDVKLSNDYICDDANNIS